MEVNLGQVAIDVAGQTLINLQLGQPPVHILNLPQDFQIPCPLPYPAPSYQHISTITNPIQPIRIYPQVGPTLGYVTRSEKLYSCCAATAYSLPLGPLELPPTAVAFRIAINTSGAGELPYGAPVLYSDRTETEVMSTLKPITNSCALESVEIQPMNHFFGG